MSVVFLARQSSPRRSAGPVAHLRGTGTLGAVSSVVNGPGAVVWTPDMSQPNVVLASYEDDSFQRENGAGVFNDNTVPWPALIEAATTGRPGRAIQFSIPANYIRYEVKPPASLNNFDVGASYFFGFAFYLDAGFPLNALDFQVIEQLHGAPNTGSPVVAFEARQDGLRLTGGFGKPNPAGGDFGATYAYDVQLLATLQTQRWYNVVFQVKFSDLVANSLVNVWVDGTQVLSNYQPPCATVYSVSTVGVNGGPTYLKSGIYHANTYGAASIWHAGHAIGNTYSSVDPTVQTVPSKFVGGYLADWSTLLPRDIPSTYNLIYMAFATIGADGTAFFTPTQNIASLKYDIAQWGTAGKTVLLSCGGGGGSQVNLSTLAQQNAFYNSITAIIDAYGFHGIDWDIEAGVPGGVNPAGMESVSRRLVARYGPKFAITMAPYGTVASSYKTLATNIKDILTFVGYQFYNGSTVPTASSVLATMNDWMTTCGLLESQFSLGFMHIDDYLGLTTPYATMASIYQSVNSAHPGVRGAWDWEISSQDQPGGYQFPAALGPVVNGTGGTTTTTTTTSVLEMGVVGWIDQVSAQKCGSGNLGAAVMRAEFTAGVSTLADVTTVADYCNAAGIRLQPLIGWDNGVPTPDLTFLGSWAAALGPGGTHWGGASPVGAVLNFELGNENAMFYKSGLPTDPTYQSLATTYGTRALAAAQAVNTANPNCAVLVELWGGDSNDPTWINNTLTAGGSTLISLMRGPTIHPYGPDWATKIATGWNYLGAFPGAQKPYYATEWGIACDNGRTMIGPDGTPDNFGWPTNLTYAQAANDFSTAFSQFAAATGSLAQVIIYQFHDTQDPGIGTAWRESYFGLLTTAWGDKGAITAVARAAFAQYRGGTHTVTTTTTTGTTTGTATPTLTAHYTATSETLAVGAGQTLNSATFTPAAYDVLLVFASSQGSQVTPTGITGGGLNWQLVLSDVGVSGQSPAVVWAATAPAAPASMHVTVTFNNASGAAGFGGFFVERWAHATLASVPADAYVTDTTATGTLTATQAGSVVAWMDADWNGVVGTPTYRSGATQIDSYHSTAQGITLYAGYQVTAAAGTQTFGLSAPTGQQATMAAVEIQLGTPVTPTLVGSYTVTNEALGLGVNQELASATFTPAAGEVIVIFASTQGSQVSPTGIAGGSLAWQPIFNDTGISGQSPAVVWAATAPATPAAMSVTVTFDNESGAAGFGGFFVERWTHATLAANPAGSYAVNASATGTLTATQAGSVVTWMDADWNGITGTPTYRSGGTQIATYHSTAQGITLYAGYQVTAAAGTQTFGVSAPTGQQATMVGFEILPGT